MVCGVVAIYVNSKGMEPHTIGVLLFLQGSTWIVRSLMQRSSPKLKVV
jgi:hypothetical protein